MTKLFQLVRKSVLIKDVKLLAVKTDLKNFLFQIFEMLLRGVERI